LVYDSAPLLKRVYREPYRSRRLLL
jgi:hypothetical protein